MSFIFTSRGLVEEAMAKASKLFEIDTDFCTITATEDSVYKCAQDICEQLDDMEGAPYAELSFHVTVRPDGRDSEEEWAYEAEYFGMLNTGVRRVQDVADWFFSDAELRTFKADEYAPDSVRNLEEGQKIMERELETVKL